MKKLILTLFTIIAVISLHAQCNSNPYLSSGSGGTVYFSDSSSIDSSWSTNYSVSYLWDFRDGFTSTQQNPCHTYGDLSTLVSGTYVTLTVTYLDSVTGNFCQDIDSVVVYFWINPCVYGNLQISASGNNLSANHSYSINVCSNVYPNSYLWSNGDTTQTISVANSGTYTCVVTSNVGCVYTASYTYNGSLTPTFNCGQMDIFEANDDYNIVSFQSSYVNNNTFPDLIDSLSFWDVFDASGINIGLYPMMYQGVPSTFSVQNLGFNGQPSDSLYVCYNAYLYDSLYQHNIWASPPQGSICSSCEWFNWNGTKWTNNSVSTPPIFSLCDSLDVSILYSSVDSIVLGSNLYSLGFTGSATYSWSEWVISPSPTGSTGVVDTNSTPSFSVNIGDTSIFILQINTIDNNGTSSTCLVPTLVYYTAGSWVSLKTTQPGVTAVDFTNQNTKSRKLIKVIDILGRETNILKNTILFYMYNDGTIEKKYISE